MKRLVLILVVVLLSLQGWAQGAYYMNKVVDFSQRGYIDLGLEVMALSDSTYLVSGVTEDTIPGAPGSYLYLRPFTLVMDSSGNVLQKQDYARPFEQMVPQNNDLFIRTHDGGYAVAGWWQWWTPNNPTSFVGRFLLKLDANLDSSWIMLDSASRVRGQILNMSRLVQTPDHGYLLCGMNYLNHLTFTKVDSAGRFLWTKVMSYGSHILWTADVLQNGNIFLVGQQSERSYVGIIDPDANTVWDTLFNNVGPGFQNGSSGKPLENGNFFIYDFFHGADGHYDMHCMWWSPSRQLLKETDVQMPNHQYAKSIMELQDGSVVLAGQTATELNDDIDNRAFLLKFWPDGDIHWLRTYYFCTLTSNPLQDCAATPDGGFIVTGASWDTTGTSIYPDTWMLKLDSMGCPFPNCGPSLSAPTPTLDNQVEAYPNPTTDRLVLRCRDHGMSAKAVLRLLRLDGSVLDEIVLPLGFEKVEFDVSRFSSGMYLWEYLNEDGYREAGRFEVAR